MICYNTIVVFVLIAICGGALVPLFLKMSESIVMPGGRGNLKDYCVKAAKLAKEGLDSSLSGASNECKSAFVRSKFGTYAAAVVPTEDSSHYNNDEALSVSSYIMREYFGKEADEVRAAAMSGVYDVYNASIVKNYLLGDEY